MRGFRLTRLYVKYSVVDLVDPVPTADGYLASNWCTNFRKKIRSQWQSFGLKMLEELPYLLLS